MALFQRNEAPTGPSIPEGLWVKCPQCQQIVWRREVERNLHVCPKCNYHFRLRARDRMALLLDDGVYQPLFTELKTADPLQFRDRRRYTERLKQAWDTVGTEDAVCVAEGTLGGFPVIVGVMEFDFIGGSMGSVVGEKVARAAERAVEARRALILVSCSGGARMMEGILSLMQMAKVAAALGRLAAARIPYISVMTDPTTGGVTASFAMLGDVHLAEPGALIGFAGPRVIEQTIRQQLPEGFQRSEFLLEHGMLDMVVHRKHLRNALIRLLRFLWNPAVHEVVADATP